MHIQYGKVRLKTSKLYGQHRYKPQRTTAAGDKKDEVVSFAYQFNFYTQGSNPYKSLLFRNYLDCWTDYNEYILNCVRSYPQGLEIYAERYDIKRYYDRIKKTHIISLLRGILAEDFERSLFPSDRDDLINLILNYSFDYPFYAPDTGEVERWHDPNMGIPQGPNLSAWLANALLFQMDKYMQGLVDNINTERQDGKRIALYARYVDDIILIAPSIDSLHSLENALRDELDTLDLSLSEKVDSISSYSKHDFVKFLYENKGLPGVSLGISEQIRNSISISRSMHNIRIQSGDRKDVLNILHYFNPFELYERKFPELLLKASVKYADTLKERDFVSISRFLWVELFFSCKDCLPAANPIWAIAQKLSDAFKKHILPPNEQKNNENDLGRFIDPLYHHRYLLISIMGFNLALSNKYHRNPLLSDSEQEYFAQGREYVIAYAKEHSDFFSAEHYAKEDKSISKLEFLIELYLRKSWQLINIDKLEESVDKNSQPHYQLPIIRRFESGASFITADSFTPITNSVNLIILYHELWLAKLGRERSGIAHSANGSFFNKALQVASVFNSEKQSGTDTSLAKYIYHIIPHLGIAVTKMCSFLLKRKEIQCLLSWDGNGDHIPFLLPSYQDITDDTFIGLNTSPNGQVHTANLFSPQDQYSSFWDHEMEQQSNIEEFAKLTNYKNSNVELNQGWKLLNPDNKLQFKMIIKLIVELYRYIDNEKKANHHPNSLMINSSNIIYRDDNGGYEVKIVSKYYQEESRVERYYLVRNTVNELYKGRDELQQIYPYSYVWRLGWALNDLFGTIQLSEADFVGTPKKLWEDGDWIDEAILLRILFDMKGIYWKGEEEKNTFPKHIQDHIEFLSKIDSADTTVKTLYLLKSQLDRRTYAVVKQHETIHEFDYEGGLKLLSTIAETLFHYDQQMIHHLNDTLFKDFQDNELELKHNRRSIYAWLVLSQKFANALNTNSADQAYAECMNEYSYLCRFRVVSILVRKLFILFSQFCYSEMGDKINADVVISNLPPDKLTDLHYIFRSINEDGVADHLRKESVTMQISMLMAIICVYKNLVTPEDIEIIDRDLNRLLSLTSESSKTIIRQFANLQPIEYPEAVTDYTLFTEFVVICGRIEDVLGIKTNQVYNHSLSIGFKDDGFSVNSTHGNYTIPFCSLNTEKLSLNDASSIEINKAKDQIGKELHSFTEVFIGEQLMEIDTVTNNLADLAGIRDVKDNVIIEDHRKTDNENADPQVKSHAHRDESNDTKQYNQSDQDSEQIEGDVLDDYLTPKNHGLSLVNVVLEKQKQIWEERSDHDRMFRIAFFQFEVDSSYRHPLSELCSYDKQNDEFLKKPWLYNNQISSQDNHNNQEEYSCAEAIRREKLKAVIEACDKFNVELLILPEYSVRPETIEYVKEILEQKSTSLAVLCGTFRIPLLADSGYLNRDSFMSTLKGHGAVLSLLYRIKKTEKYKIKTRGKKYRSEASKEFFRPSDRIIEPLGKTPPVERNSIINHMLELICSECFILTSPIQHDWLAESWIFLRKQYGEDYNNNHDFRDIVHPDIRNFRDEVIGKPKEYPSNLRKLLIVPSMTSRVRDFYNLGEQFIFTVSGSMVLCNAVYGIHGRGGSCVISGESYNDKKDNVWVSQCNGPYGDVQPGIYQRGTHNEGALGQEEEALVIFDIDPLTAINLKPNNQARPNSLKLVAHLPIVEYYPTAQDIVDNNNFKCACSRLTISQSSYTKGVKTHEWVASYLQLLSDILAEPSTNQEDNIPPESFSPNKQSAIPDKCNYDNMTEKERKRCNKSHQIVACPPKKDCGTPLSQVFINMFGTKGNKWIEKKVEEYYKQHGNKQFLHSESGKFPIPVAFLDFLLVDYTAVLEQNRKMLIELQNADSYDIQDGKQKDELRRSLKPKLSIPPFSKFDRGGYDE